MLSDEGYLKVAGNVSESKKTTKKQEGQEEEVTVSDNLINLVSTIKKGALLDIGGYNIKEGETSPPKRYTSGTLILAMENAGQLIDDEELRAQIKGSGIGTSATRAEILKKLVKISYLSLNNKTQVITPTQLGEMIYDVVGNSIKSLLNAELTASWEKGLTYVSEGSITKEEYMKKLEDFISKWTNGVKGLRNQYILKNYFDNIAKNYK